MTTSAPVSRRLDQVAIAMSGVCAVHCLLGPLLTVLAPAVLASLGVSDEVFHVLLLALVLPTSAGALALGCRRHRDGGVVALGALGLGALGLAVILGHDALGEPSERGFTLAGAVVVAAAHARNFQLCRRDRCHP
jgi:MerC mercury resistance protein